MLDGLGRQQVIDSIFNRAGSRRAVACGWTDPATVCGVGKRDCESHAKGQPLVPEGCHLICVEGDDEWTELPDPVLPSSDPLKNKAVGAPRARGRSTLTAGA